MRPVFRQCADPLEELGDRGLGNSVPLNQRESRSLQVGVQLVILRTLLGVERNRGERELEGSNQSVSGRPLVVQVEADPTKVATKDLVSTVAPLERRG